MLPRKDKMLHPEIRPSEHQEKFSMFRMSKERRGLFEAEREFLQALGEKLSSEGRLIEHLQDVCSTEIAKIVGLRYGFNNQRRCFSTPEIGRHQNKPVSSVIGGLRIGLQTLWLLHHAEFNPESQLVSILEQRYVLEESACQNKKPKGVFRAAQALVEVYHDREFLKSLGEEKLLDLLSSVYGSKTAEIFARYYRLIPFRLSTNYGLTGDISNLSSQTAGEFKGHVREAVDVGRAVAEHLAGEEYGSWEWTDGRGKRKRGYATPKAKNVARRLAGYQRQKAIQKDLAKASLKGWEKELLLMTTRTKLKGGSKSDGLRRFNLKHQTGFALGDVAELERRVLEGKVSTRVRSYWLERKNTLERFFNSGEAQSKLAKQLRHILYSYHLQAKTIKSLSEDYPVSYKNLCSIRIFLEDLCWQQGFKQGEPTEEKIRIVFGEDRLPPELLEILKEYAQGQKTASAVVQAKGLLTTRAAGLGGIVQMIIDKDL